MTQDRSRYRCAFCGQHQDDVEGLVAGPNAFICERCVRGIAANFQGTMPATVPLLEKRPRHAINTVHGRDARCTFCGKRWDDVQWVVHGRPAVLICAECVWLVLQIMNEPPPARPTSRVDRTTGGRRWRTWVRWPGEARRIDQATRL